MTDVIDAIFDHAFVVSAADRVMMEMFFPGEKPAEMLRHYQSYIDRQLERYCATADKIPLMLRPTLFSEQDKDGMKIVPVPFSPTAENMAAYMFKLLDKPLQAHFDTAPIKLTNIRLFETPNGWVDHSRGPVNGLEN